MCQSVCLLCRLPVDLSVGAEVRKWKRKIGETLGEYEGGLAQGVAHGRLGDDPTYGLYFLDGLRAYEDENGFALIDGLKDLLLGMDGFLELHLEGFDLQDIEDS